MISNRVGDVLDKIRVLGYHEAKVDSDNHIILGSNPHFRYCVLELDKDNFPKISVNPNLPNLNSIEAKSLSIELSILSQLADEIDFILANPTRLETANHHLD